MRPTIWLLGRQKFDVDWQCVWTGNVFVSLSSRRDCQKLAGGLSEANTTGNRWIDNLLNLEGSSNLRPFQGRWFVFFVPGGALLRSNPRRISSIPPG
ncbi:hypothetical protein FHS27_004409 [Rhodopirellula rubra]|uniref:Uncharacterized protein n=1 Tax=Aporhodopirellula rubra TaxID=980271 RepID=A0A7W5E1R2_9BACT|nr:hypothetical protein [Aporhodopirellula rubra]